MNSPYEGKFYISQGYYPGMHDGLDLVGVDSKEIHATQRGTVQYAGWENPANHKQGFGQYVCIKGVDGNYYYFGHLSQLKVCTGQTVNITDVIGVEGSTGYSTGVALSLRDQKRLLQRCNCCGCMHTCADPQQRGRHL